MTYVDIKGGTSQNGDSQYHSNMKYKATRTTLSDQKKNWTNFVLIIGKICILYWNRKQMARPCYTYEDIECTTIFFL